MKHDGRKRFREVSYYRPETNISFAEDRMLGFVDEYNWRQRFSAMLPRGPGNPTPTLLDLTVSAYLQGVNDTVQVATERGLDFGGNDEHLRRRGEAVRVNRGDAEGAESTGTGLEGRGHQPAVTAPEAGARRDGPHSPEQEFGMSLW
jgi:hypothetical protein